jgi:hypothetical protein
VSQEVEELGSRNSDKLDTTDPRARTTLFLTGPWGLSSLCWLWSLASLHRCAFFTDSSEYTWLKMAASGLCGCWFLHNLSAFHSKQVVPLDFISGEGALVGLDQSMDWFPLSQMSTLGAISDDCRADSDI